MEWRDTRQVEERAEDEKGSSLLREDSVSFVVRVKTKTRCCGSNGSGAT